MNKEALLAQYGYFNMVHGVTLKLIGTLADEDLHYRPRPDMRSVGDLILHTYGMLRSFAVGVAQGELPASVENANIPETPEGKEAMSQLKTVADCQRFAETCFQEIQAALAAASAEQLAAQVKSPFGTFAGWQYFSFAYDEHWHHRGQLYTYVRLMGKEPPMLYSYDG